MQIRCQRAMVDLLDALQLKKKYPERVHFIRYEDLCMKTSEVVGTLLKFLDLSKNILIDKFIKDHTQANPTHPWDSYSTTRISRNMAFGWRNTLSDYHIRKIQDMCKEPMNKLGYLPMKNISINKLDPSYQLINESHFVFDL